MQTLSPLLTDLYQLTMMQAYHDRDMHEEASFEFFFRDFSPKRNFLVACGLEQVLEYLEDLRFSQEDIDYLHKDGRFNERFLEYLSQLRFHGDVTAMEEGTVFFADEPILRITAPLPLGQLVETRIVNILQFQTMIASKAVRMTRLLPDKLLIDYGLRRAHGAEAGLMAARASYIAGFSGSATVLAGQMYGLPTFGTMAHSFIQAHDNEEDAFYHFATSHPDNCVLLLDTYDTERATERVIALADRLSNEGKDISIRGVRLDSGDMVTLSKKVRAMLDGAGLTDIMIFASGNLDEYSLDEYRRQNAPVDGFGIGTKMTTSADSPYFDCAYKLVEYRGQGRRKLATRKATWPGKKQIFRISAPDGSYREDILALRGEDSPGTPLLQEQMINGRRVGARPELAQIRQHLQKELARLPEQIDQSTYRYPVTPSQQLQRYSEEVASRLLSISG